MRMAPTLLGAALLLGATAAPADEAAVRRMMVEQIGGEARIDSVNKASWGSMYEVVVRGPRGPLVFYVDDKASVIFAGQVIEAKSGRNITEEKLQRLSTIKWETLPMDAALTTVRGNGRRKIAVFSDPNCPYCKKFETELELLDDITVHIFLYPVIKPQSVTQTKSVWCSKDRVKAWNDLILRGIQPTAKPDCDTPIDRILALGRELGANSTPTWFLQDGVRRKGVLPIAEVTRLMDVANPKK